MIGNKAITASFKQMLWLAIGSRKIIRKLRRSKKIRIIACVDTLILPLARVVSLVR